MGGERREGEQIMTHFCRQIVSFSHTLEQLVPPSIIANTTAFQASNLAMKLNLIHLIILQGKW